MGKISIEERFNTNVELKQQIGVMNGLSQDECDEFYDEIMAEMKTILDNEGVSYIETDTSISACIREDKEKMIRVANAIETSLFLLNISNKDGERLNGRTIVCFLILHGLLLIERRR